MRTREETLATIKAACTGVSADHKSPMYGQVFSLLTDPFGQMEAKPEIEAKGIVEFSERRDDKVNSKGRDIKPNSTSNEKLEFTCSEHSDDHDVNASVMSDLATSVSTESAHKAKSKDSREGDDSDFAASDKTSAD